MTTAATATQLIRIANDVELEVLVCGPEAGPAVILLHGFPQTAVMWEKLSAGLASAGYRTIAPNQRGYGQTKNSPGVDEYDIDRLAADVRGLAEVLGYETYAIVGHDWGAAVGWWLASHPDGCLNCLVAISAPHPAIWRQAMNDDRDQRTASRYVRFFRIPLFPELLIRLMDYSGLEHAVADAGATLAARSDYRKSWRTPGNLTGMLNWYRALLRRSFTTRVDVALPTLFIYGRKDRFLSVSAAKRTAAISPSIEAAPLEGGHWLVEQCSPQIRRLVLDFLKRKRASAADDS